MNEFAGGDKVSIVNVCYKKNIVCILPTQCQYIDINAWALKV